MSQPEHRATVLVVEDEWLIAAMTIGILEDEGYSIIGPASSVAQGLDLIGTQRIDAALLDVNLGSEPSFPLADALIEHGTPVTLLTGYQGKDLPERFRAVPTLSKPVMPDVLLKAVAGMLAPAPPPR